MYYSATIRSNNWYIYHSTNTLTSAWTKFKFTLPEFWSINFLRNVEKTYFTRYNIPQVHHLSNTIAIEIFQTFQTILRYNKNGCNLDFVCCRLCISFKYISSKIVSVVPSQRYTRLFIYVFIYLYISVAHEKLKNAPLRLKQTKTKTFLKYVFLWRNTEWHKKTGTFENPNKNWRNPRKKNLLTEIEPLQLAF